MKRRYVRRHNRQTCASMHLLLYSSQDETFTFQIVFTMIDATPMAVSPPPSGAGKGTPSVVYRNGSAIHVSYRQQMKSAI